MPYHQLTIGQLFKSIIKDVCHILIIMWMMM